MKFVSVTGKVYHWLGVVSSGELLLNQTSCAAHAGGLEVVQEVLAGSLNVTVEKVGSVVAEAILDLAKGATEVVSKKSGVGVVRLVHKKSLTLLRGRGKYLLALRRLQFCHTASLVASRSVCSASISS